MITRTLKTIAVAGSALALTALGVGCTTESLDEVAPQDRQLDFTGDTLDVRQQGMPTDLSVADREGVLVSYRASTTAGELREPELTLEDGKLDLGDPCPPLVLCDVRYAVEVPEGVTVLRDGESTDITG